MLREMQLKLEGRDINKGSWVGFRSSPFFPICAQSILSSPNHKLLRSLYMLFPAVVIYQFFRLSILLSLTFVTAKIISEKSQNGKNIANMENKEEQGEKVTLTSSQTSIISNQTKCFLFRKCMVFRRHERFKEIKFK